MAASDNLHPDQQPSLFDIDQYTRKRSPEEMGPDAWLEHHGAEGTLTHHATFREDWRDAPTVHAGTIGQASYRLHRVADTIRHSPLQAQSYYDPSVGEGFDDDSSGDIEEPQTHTGRMYAFRMSGGVHSSTLSDRDANDADALYQVHQGAEPWEVSRSVRDSMSDYAKEMIDYSTVDDELPETTGTRELEQGKSIRYSNAVESANAIDRFDDPNRKVSHLVPKRAIRTWEDDVIANPHASQLAQDYAQQRIGTGRAGSIAFPEGNIDQRDVHTAMPLEHLNGDLFVPGSAGGKGPKTSVAQRRNIDKIQFTVTPPDDAARKERLKTYDPDDDNYG
jgi:hypothetical protein